MKKKTWMVRAGEGSRLFDEFKDKNVIGIGWNELGDLTKIKDINALKKLFSKIYPDASKGQRDNNSGQIFRFINEFSINDNIVTYDSSSRLYSIGKITSDYKYSPKLIEYHHIREIEWTKEVERDSLSTQSKNSLGSTLTIFKINEYTQSELLNGISKIESEQIESDETLEEIKEDFESRAIEFIKDNISILNWDQMQDLVAGLLRSMGYKTVVSPRGSDRGKDILASPDGLGLEDPRILIEVKHRKGKMGAPEIRSFIGGLRTGEKGIYVSTGGFSKEAMYEAERANYPLTCINIDMLVQLVIQNYDNFDLETRALLPLRKIYWPIK